MIGRSRLNSTRDCPSVPERPCSPTGAVGSVVSVMGLALRPRRRPWMPATPYGWATREWYGWTLHSALRSPGLQGPGDRNRCDGTPPTLRPSVVRRLGRVLGVRRARRAWRRPGIARPGARARATRTGVRAGLRARARAAASTGPWATPPARPRVPVIGAGAAPAAVVRLGRLGRLASLGRLGRLDGRRDRGRRRGSDRRRRARRDR